MLYAGFNQDSSCFSVGTTSDYRVFSTDPIKLRFIHEISKEIGEIGMVEMLFRTNIFDLIGTENNKEIKSNCLAIWDDKEKKIISNLTFSSNILRVKLRKDKFFNSTQEKIHVFSFPDFQPIDEIKTGENIHGVIAITTDPKICLLAYPDTVKGHVRIKNYDPDSNKVN